MMDKKIVMLAGAGVSSNIIFHAINNNFPVHSDLWKEVKIK